MKKTTTLILLLWFTLSANAQLAKTIFDRVKKDVEHFANDVEYKKNTIIGDASQDIVSRFKALFEEVLGESDEIMINQQEILFANIQSTLYNVFQNVTEQQKIIDKSISSMGNILSNTIISNKRPLITSFQIPTLVRNSSKDFDLKFYGVKLNNKRNYLEIGDRTIDFSHTSISTDNQIVFRIDSINTHTNSDKVNVTLHLHKKRKDFPQNFDIKIIPKHIADVTIYYISKYDCSESFNRIVTLPNCTSSSINKVYKKRGECAEFITPTNNKRSIDVSSVQFYRDDIRHRRRYYDLKKITPSGIQINIHRSSDKHDKIKCQFTEIEEKTCKKTKMQTFSLDYGKPIIFTLNDISIIQSVEVTYYNGETELLDTYFSSNSLIKYAYNPASKTILISTSNKVQ